MLALNRLDRRDRTVLVEQIAGRKALPDERRRPDCRSHRRRAAVVEELTKSVLESGLLREEADRYVLDRPLPAACDPDYVAGLADGTARPLGVGAAGGAGWRGDRTRISVRAAPCGLLRSFTENGVLQAPLARLVASELVFPAAARRRKRSIASSTRWCRTRRTAACCAIPVSDCTRRSPRRSKPIPPRLMDNPARALSRSIMRKLGSLKNPSPVGARPVGDPPPARQWRKPPRNSKKRWTSWRCCPDTPERQR